MMFTESENITQALIGLGADISAMKDVLGNTDSGKPTADNKKQPRIMELEEIL